MLGEFDGRVTQRNRLRYRRFVEEGLLRGIENPFEAVQWQMVLGSESLVQKVKDKLRSRGDRLREVTGVRRSTNVASEPRKLVARVAAGYGISVNKLLREPVYGSQARNVAIWLVWQNTDLSLREIGSLFGGLDYAAVSQRIRRLRRRAKIEKKLKQTLQMLNV